MMDAVKTIFAMAFIIVVGYFFYMAYLIDYLGVNPFQ